MESVRRQQELRKKSQADRLLRVPRAGSLLWSKCTEHGGSESVPSGCAGQGRRLNPRAASLTARCCAPTVAHAALPEAQGLGGQSHKLALVLEAGCVHRGTRWPLSCWGPGSELLTRLHIRNTQRAVVFVLCFIQKVKIRVQ